MRSSMRSRRVEHEPAHRRGDRFPGWRLGGVGPPLPQIRAEFPLLFRVDDHPCRGDHDQAADPVRVVKGEARPDPGPQGHTDIAACPIPSASSTARTCPA